LGKSFTFWAESFLGGSWAKPLYRINGKPTTVPSKVYIMEKLAADK
jgi:hypothetical protein